MRGRGAVAAESVGDVADAQPVDDMDQIHRDLAREGHPGAAAGAREKILDTHPIKVGDHALRQAAPARAPHGCHSGFDFNIFIHSPTPSLCGAVHRYRNIIP